VIGMSACADVSLLDNPASDARAIADAFSRSHEREDLSGARAGINRAHVALGDCRSCSPGHGDDRSGARYCLDGATRNTWSTWAEAMPAR
jgi:hypothetical protein